MPFPRDEEHSVLAFRVPRSWIARALLLCVALAGIGSQLIPPRSVWTTQIQASSRGIPVSLGAQRELCAPLSRPHGALLITGTFKASTLGNYPNVFQTASPSRGIRMEVAPTGTVGVALFSRTVGYTGVVSGAKIKRDRASSFSLAVDADGTITLEIGGSTDKAAIPKPNITCGHVLVGGGFDPDRDLHGRADPVIFKSGTVTPFFVAWSGVAVVGLLLLLWILAGSLAGPSHRRSEKDLTVD